MSSTRIFERNLARALDEFHLPEDKMIFITGSRQSGKTTFSKQYLINHNISFEYLNWDNYVDRRRIGNLHEEFAIEDKMSPAPQYYILDEIHKYPKWKNILKGLYDKYANKYRFLITGSGRLDLFRKGGDSLQGRYFLYNMFPFSVGEILKNKIGKTIVDLLKIEDHQPQSREIFEVLFQFSGYPEPFLAQNKAHLNRWRRLRIERFINEDIRDTTRIADILGVEQLVRMLDTKIGSPFSANSLREDMNVSYNTIKNWLKHLKALFFFFEIKPYSKNVIKVLKKEPKIYLFEYSSIKDESNRFENIIALHLYKLITLNNDLGISNGELFYIRDKNGKEVDFLIVEDEIPITLIECKMSDLNPSSQLIKFANSLNIKRSYQVVFINNIYKIHKINGREFVIISAEILLSKLI